jgi:uncharacterized membrane protein
MTDLLLAPLTLISALGASLVAGIFFAFSTFVMQALGRLPAANGIAAMQSINITVINPIFMSVFLGTALICSLLAVMACLRWQLAGSGFVLAGCLLYLVGSFGVTMAFNVPLNDQLAPLAPESAESARFWQSYLGDWTRWNTLRCLAALLAAAAFVQAWRLQGD